MKLSKWLTWYWGAMLASTVLGLFDQMLFTLLSLIASIMQLYAVAQLRHFHERIRKSFTYTIISLILSVVTIVTTLLGAAIASAGPFSVWIGLVLIVLIATAVFALLSSYHFYRALDELREQNGYDYPAGQICWCFYLAIIGAVISAVIQQLASGALFGILISFAFQIGVLALLWGYLQAVKLHEVEIGDPDWPEL